MSQTAGSGFILAGWFFMFVISWTNVYTGVLFIMYLTMAALSHSMFASIVNLITAAMLRDMIKGSPLVIETNTSFFPVQKVKHL